MLIVDVKKNIAQNIRQDFIYKYNEKYIDENSKLQEKTKMSHFLVVRFNLYIHNLREKVGLLDNNKYLEWVKNRSELFINGLLKNIIEQTNKDFKTLIYFDVEIDSYTQRVIDVISKHKNIHAVLLDLRNSDETFKFEESLRQEVEKLMKNHSFVTTTRVDCDDLINIGFMENLIDYCSYIAPHTITSNGIVVNFPHGMQIANGKSRVLMYNRNPFITLVEPRSKFFDSHKWIRKTVFQFSHDRCDRFCKVENAITRFPMWAQVIHEENAMNVEHKYLPTLEYSKGMDEMFSGCLNTMMK
jgi:hypothetical protein